MPSDDHGRAVELAAAEENDAGNEFEGLGVSFQQSAFSSQFSADSFQFSALRTPHSAFLACPARLQSGFRTATRRPHDSITCHLNSAGRHLNVEGSDLANRGIVSTLAVAFSHSTLNVSTANVPLSPAQASISRTHLGLSPAKVAFSHKQLRILRPKKTVSTAVFIISPAQEIVSITQVTVSPTQEIVSPTTEESSTLVLMEKSNKSFPQTSYH